MICIVPFPNYSNKLYCTVGGEPSHACYLSLFVLISFTHVVMLRILLRHFHDGQLRMKEVIQIWDGQRFNHWIFTR